MITKSPRAESRTIPTTRERLRRRYPTLLRPSIADTRVEQGIDDVEDEGRDPESDDDREHDSLDEEVIVLTNGVKQNRSHAGVAEDDLDQHRSREDVAERERQRGGLRQDRVPDAVPQKDRRTPQPFGFGEEDVVFP